MPSARLPEWFLCVDAGGTSCKVAIASSHNNEQVFTAIGGPCNVKAIGSKGAILVILSAVQQALAKIPTLDFKADGTPPPPLPTRFFSKVWLGLAGVLHARDIDDVAPHAQEAFGIPSGDPALRISNDGFLLAAPSLALPHIDTTLALVAGTGSVNLAFRKVVAEIQLIGMSGGWGYLLGDEGSAFAVGRLAMRRLLTDYDARTTASFRSGEQEIHPPLLPFFIALLAALKVPDAATMVDRTYSDCDELERKLWIARGSQTVYDYAFDRISDVDEASRAVALEIVREAISPTVDTVISLLGKNGEIDPQRTLLSLGGGMWSAEGYRSLLLDGLEAQGVTFAEVRFVESAAEEGARALRAPAA
ncbi:hypothetical protein JCM10908_007312 [Rhodotorula pacifica]|uniref:uncharacterized protein n=1 Tax=Rhodotorula pacifica TaxID=1495444 RepID=UPI0031815A27